jgi:uncharacterized protein YcfL
MKKIMIALAGLLLMFTYGCGSDEEQETTENETVIQSQEKAAEMRGEETTAPDENAIETEEQTEESGDTVKETKKRPVIEGC